MALGIKKGSILLASLLFGTFGLHAVYRAQAQTADHGVSGPLAPVLAAVQGLGEPRPAVVTASDGKVQLTATADRGAVLHQGDGIVQVEVTVKADALPGAPQRTPTDLVVVVDHSGSMQGQKLDYAKQALLGLIDRLGPEDRLGVVLFDHAADVLFPLQSPVGSSRDHWRALVRSISSAGGTSIGGGLDAGLSLISEPAQERVTRVLLLSDGQDSSGLPALTARARQITSRQGVLSTLGIGQDFDEQVMTSLASAGTGAFYYMAKPEVLPAMLDAELKTATETYASGAELHLRLGDGVRVTGAGGIPVETRGGEAVIPVGSLYAGRERKIWLGLSVPTDRLLERELGKLQLSYRRAGTTFEVSGTELPKVACVADQTSYETRINPAVWGRGMVEEELNRAREELGDAIARGTAQDVDRSVERVESQRVLAERLGQSQVVQEIVSLREDGSKAKLAQQADPMARAVSAKTQKAIGYGKRNVSSYGSVDFTAGF